MEPITECQIDLFSGSLPSTDEIKKLSEFVHSNEANEIAFAEQVEANISWTGQKVCLAIGIGLYLLRRDAEAVQKLGPEVALFRVHGADEDKPGRMAEGYPFPFQTILPGGSGIENNVNDMIVKQVDLVHV